MNGQMTNFQFRILILSDKIQYSRYIDKLVYFIVDTRCSLLVLLKFDSSIWQIWQFDLIKFKNQYHKIFSIGFKTIFREHIK